jgi:hypothetical protein
MSVTALMHAVQRTCMESSDLAKQSPPVALKNPEIFWDQAATSLARRRWRAPDCDGRTRSRTGTELRNVLREPLWHVFTKKVDPRSNLRIKVFAGKIQSMYVHFLRHIIGQDAL